MVDLTKPPIEEPISKAEPVTAASLLKRADFLDRRVARASTCARARWGRLKSRGEVSAPWAIPLAGVSLGVGLAFAPDAARATGVGAALRSVLGPLGGIVHSMIKKFV